MSCMNIILCKIILIVMIVLIFKFNISEIFNVILFCFQNYSVSVSIHLDWRL